MKPIRLLRSRPFLALVVLGGLSLVALAQTPATPTEAKLGDKEHAEKMAKGTELFKKHVRPLLVAQCLGCHGGDKTEGELEIIDRAHLIKGGDAGPALVPGDPDKSLLYRMITHQKKPVMPYKKPKLPDADIAFVRQWIELGAPYDKPLVSTAEVTSWTKKTIDPAARQHWAFQPLTSPKVPAVRQAAAVSNPVDAFLVAGWEKANLVPGRRTTKVQLLRRAYFNLVGLPPTPEQVAAFEKDASPEAFAKVVDGLLASPRYGERWAAHHWLDLARFGESHGFEHDYDRPTAWPYRDFVIKALNDDLPWTDFVRWQLAGDEIAPDNIEALKATGFLAAGVHSTQITKNEAEKHRYDEMDDMLATTTTAMLGLTVGCARCHDHKFDPFPQADYYRMLATFTTTIRADVEREVHRDKYLAAKAAFDAAHAPLVEARRKYEVESLPKTFAAWEASRKATPMPTGWILPEIASMTSAGGATLTKQDDGSIKVTGKNPTIETLDLNLTSDLAEIRSLRIEALADAGLVKNGPGRGANGNFALTDLIVVIDGKAAKLKNPKSTFDQKGLGVAGAIDGDPVNSEWAVDPQFGKTHAATFELETPVLGAKVHTVRVTMKFHNNVGHGMGRPRVSLSSTAPGLIDPAADSKFESLLAKPAATRTPAETETLHRWYAPKDAGWQALTKAIDSHAAKTPKPETVKMMISSEGIPAIRLHTQGDDFLPATHFLRRGDENQKEGEAAPGYLQVVTRTDADVWKKAPPKGSKLSYRRTALADWMVDTDKGAGHLLARVAVNRVWQHHFGHGLVDTPSDFGLRGDKPSHPELLDYLAGELIRNGWKLKSIHKLILTSQAFAQTSEADAARVAADRSNALVSRYPVRRLEAEVIRDTILSASGQLDETMYGPGSLDENSRRRSIYFTIKRSKLIPMLAIFDAPDGTVGVGDRGATTIAPQALHLMNHPSMRTAARSLATVASTGRTDPAEVVRAMYQRVVSRAPTADETRDALEFLTAQQAGYAGKADAKVLALTDLAQVLFCLNEMIYVD